MRPPPPSATKDHARLGISDRHVVEAFRPSLRPTNTVRSGLSQTIITARGRPGWGGRCASGRTADHRCTVPGSDGRMARLNVDDAPFDGSTAEPSDVAVALNALAAAARKSGATMAAGFEATTTGWVQRAVERMQPTMRLIERRVWTWRRTERRRVPARVRRRRRELSTPHRRRRAARARARARRVDDPSPHPDLAPLVAA